MTPRPRAHAMNTQHTTRALLTLAVIGAAALTGCRGTREDEPPRQFFPDMDDQMKWTPQSSSEMFADGRTLRPVVPNTVAWGRSSATGEEPWAGHWKAMRGDLLKADDVFYTGVEGKNADGTPKYVRTIPKTMPVDVETLLRGQDRYNIYCTACHGYAGDGQGMVAKAGYNPVVPSYFDATFFDSTNNRSLDGYIFHTIRHGKPDAANPEVLTMPAYGHALNERDAWAVVAYVRTLQASRTGTLADVPASKQDALKGKPKPIPATPAPGGAP
ncbi:MAG: quinol:cytochrome C oxidoreductase [Phycisphaerae bacterium]|nr:MAG: quinol:cytochrome C oxidoreductase [Phycisphaerae bacterium]